MPNKGTEAHFWAAIRTHIPEAHWQRIESGLTAAGVPDVNGCYLGHEVWLELKIVRGRRVHLTPNQTNWLVKRSTYGGHCFVVAQDIEGKILLWAGRFAREVMEDGIRALGRIDIEDWDHLKKVIFNR
jgi:hypothetical protein